MQTMKQLEESSCNFRRIGQGFCGSVWAAEGGKVAMKRENGGPGRSILTDYNMHRLVLDAASQDEVKVNVCVPRWPRFVENNDPWWHSNLAIFPKRYAACNILCSERIPPLSKEVRDILIDRYCPPSSIATIKNNDADRDCLVRLYLGRRKIQNSGRRGLNFFSLRNYPLHLNQAEELGLQILNYACDMADMLARMHWTAKIDANDVEFVIGGIQETTIGEHTHSLFGRHALWLLDFDCCRPLAMDDAGVTQAARAFLRNDPYFPRPAIEGSSDHALWMKFRSQYLESSKARVGLCDAKYLSLPEQFINQVEESHHETMKRKQSASHSCQSIHRRYRIPPANLRSFGQTTESRFRRRENLVEDGIAVEWDIFVRSEFGSGQSFSGSELWEGHNWRHQMQVVVLALPPLNTQSGNDTT
ncbi:hypothetical protein A1O1_08234 [Capronia coronata CBS 617.96]|uniref:DUF3669 domain-containing protein n=1 Tax=Capronia coronata CBS 617.96 TaxID=1182541 RepID=W9XXR8_9EURO|nr:uncharacterized protein A1O1_08234 [Capronia coronata CBS 617.96]EXJ82165.1 hypothetical protein A1O1_08234 [Capronia coronata CBS 617.96]